MSDQLRHELHELTQPLPHRDLTAGVFRRYRRRRVQRGAAVAASVAIVLAAGSWAFVAVSSGSPGPDVVGPPPAGPPLPATASPSVDPTGSGATLAGTFYYHQSVGLEPEQLWAWTVGDDEPQLLGEVGDPEDLAQAFYAWQSTAVADDASRVAWVRRDGQVSVLDTGSGEREGFDIGADRDCFPPVWHPDSTRLLVHTGPAEFGWLDVESGQLEPVAADLRDACAPTVFPVGPATVAVAFEDVAAHAIVAVTESGDELWRIDVTEVDDRLDPAEHVWGLADVSDGGGYACINILRDVAGGAGGTRSLAGNVVVETATGTVVADGRPAEGLCSMATQSGYVTRVNDPQAEDFDDFSQQLRLTGYDGGLLAAVDEPPQLYLTTLIGYSPGHPAAE